jgi:membrane protein implicated in regulation of membrane protease activity
MGNKSLRFGTSEVKSVSKVFLWSFGSALVAALLSVLEVWQFPAEYAAFVPVVNTLLYAAKEFFADNSK